MVASLLQFLFSGITVGSVYALIGASLVMVYKGSRVICFAQGEYVVFGALTTTTLLERGVPLPVAAMLAVVGAMVLGTVLQRALIRPLDGRPIGTLIVMTIAMSLLLRGTALLVWGRDSHVMRPFSRGEPISVAGASLQPQVLWIVGTTAALLALLWVVFEKTVRGLSVRACSENRLGARLVGVAVEATVSQAWAWGAAIGALAGIVVAPLFFMQYSSGAMPMVKGFIAMSIGGVNSIVGAVTAGLLLGVLEGFTTGVVSSKFSDTIVFSVLILVLVLRPQGVFSRA